MHPVGNYYCTLGGHGGCSAEELRAVTSVASLDREHNSRVNSSDSQSGRSQSQIIMVADSSTHEVDHPSWDGRRGVSIGYELLSRVDGSARFGFGTLLKVFSSIRFLIVFLYSTDDTHVLASASGPIEVRPAVENSTKAIFEVSVRPLASMPGTDAKALGATIKSLLTSSLLLTRHPRTLIQLVVQPLSPSLVGSPKTIPPLHPGIAAASINASSLALMNASVAMKGVVCAVAVARTSSKGFILNPTRDQLVSSTASGCFAFIFTGAGLSNDQLRVSEVWSNWQSSLRFDAKEMFGARELAQQGAGHVWELMKESIGSFGVPSSDDVEVKAESTDRLTGDGGDEDKMEI